ncbi:hypothetical protein E4191_10960 [Paracoccus liaowanqingii]|uniref:Uncharacterized protein n=1 Tax=Paracoccus liaowanqingii TaxID=2560053 RepID=A0A4P7HLU6_9RHOB|nr:hypothetical protein [Paracoccus liaowanqingii]QBX35156.1 hypothetical protein E4191_10960 [Paracoccus liaowanqingii]
MRGELADALALVIEKHLPSSARELGWSDMGTERDPLSSDRARTDAENTPPPEAEDNGGNAAFFRTQVHVATGGETGTTITRHSQTHARLLLLASYQGEGWFDASFDAEPLERLARALNEAQKALNDLSPSAEMRVSWPLLVTAILKSGGAAASSGRATDNIQLLHGSTKRTFDDVRRRPRPGKGRNWRAAAVADACRTVWAIEKWAESEGKSPAAITMGSEETAGDSGATWNRYLETAAPLFEKNHVPGPFGRFLEDIVKSLGIFGKNGRPVSAAHALRACSQARTQLSRK